MSTTAERVQILMNDLGVDQPGLGAIAGTSKSVVNQWLSGLIKKINPKYAYKLEEKHGYNPEWVMFGTGEKFNHNKTAVQTVLTAPEPTPEEREINELSVLIQRIPREERTAMIAMLRIRFNASPATKDRESKQPGIPPGWQDVTEKPRSSKETKRG